MWVDEEIGKIYDYDMNPQIIDILLGYIKEPSELRKPELSETSGHDIWIEHPSRRKAQI
ncbi:MAG TPA: hypothetical protein VIR58_10675 [Acidimicrobiales bacterium]